MATLKHLRVYFWTIDPGYFNLKQAARTILAILISLWLVRDEAMLIKLITGVASGAATQGVIGRSLLARIVHVLIFDMAYFASLSLGFMVRDYPYWTAIVLVALGFFVNYIRRFGLDNSIAPMVAWVLCFLATILPVQGDAEVWSLVYGILVGLSVSAVVSICIFPENYPRLFINNANQFFQCLAQGLHDMRRHVLYANEKANFATLPFASIKVTLDQILASNQTIQQSAFLGREQKRVAHILMHQYALLSAYSLMIDVYHSLWLCKHQFSRPAALALTHMNKEFSRFFSTIRVGTTYNVSEVCNAASLPKLAERLGRIELLEPSMIMALLNFKLGFDLLNKHGVQLLRGVDDT